MSKKAANYKNVTKLIEKMEKYKEQRQCPTCKKRCFGEMVICTMCEDYSYCSKECLEQDALHRGLCKTVGLKKGVLGAVPDEVVKQAKFPNHAGDFKSLQDAVAGTNVLTTSQVKESTGQKKAENEMTYVTLIDMGGRGDSTVTSLASGSLGNLSSAINDLDLMGESFGETWWKAKGHYRPKEDTKKKVGKEAEEGKQDKEEKKGKQDKKEMEDKIHKEDKYGKRDQKGKLNQKGKQEKKGSRDEKRKWDMKCKETKKENEEGNDEKDHSLLGETSEGAAGGQEPCSTLPDRNGKAEEEGPKKLEKCWYCHVKSFTMLKCSRCKIGRYCNKECQAKDFPKHKKKCALRGRFLRAMDRIPTALQTEFNLRKWRRLCVKLRKMPSECDYRLMRVQVSMLLEVVGPHLLPFRHTRVLRDIEGAETYIAFYLSHGDDVYYPSKNSSPMPLDSCLQPGNFILVLDTHWHHFLDGSVGIRVDELSDVRFIFN